MGHIRDVLREMDYKNAQLLMSDPNILTQIILDCSSSKFIHINYPDKIENISRGLCFALHIARSSALSLRVKV